MYRFLSPTRVVGAQNKMGRWEVVLIDTETGQYEVVPTPFTFIIRMELVGEHLYLVAASQTMPLTLVRLNLDSGEYDVVNRSVQFPIDKAYISAGGHLAFPTETVRKRTATTIPPEPGLRSAGRRTPAVDGQRSWRPDKFA